MTGSRAATRYAKAILGYAQEQGSLEAVHANLSTVATVVKENKDLRSMIESPVIKSEVKGKALKEIFTDFSDDTAKLFALLLENNRIELLAMVAEKFVVLYDEHMNKQNAVVTTAVPLSAELEAMVLAKVKELTGKEVTLENKVDETIIGGFILRVGDMQYNASIASKLNNLKRDFVGNAAISA